MPPCSRPDQPALLEALSPVFKLSSIRPVMNMKTITNISNEFILYGILGVDEKAQVLTTYIWQTLTWRSEFIRWDPEQCGTTRITLPRSLLWVPDVVVNEFMYKNSAPFVPYCYVYSDGTVMDAQPIRLVSSCNLNSYTFPFEVQTCSLSFNSYMLHEVLLSPSMSAQEILEHSKAVITTMGEWELVGLTMELQISVDSFGQDYQEIRYFLKVRRRATLYVANLIIPSCFLITVDLFSFLLPPLAVDRSSFKMSLIFGTIFFLQIMIEMLPDTGNGISLLNVFFSLCLGLMVASLLEIIFITNLLNGSENISPVPHWIRVVVLQFLGFLVCLPLKTKKSDSFDMKPNTVLAQRAADAEHPGVAALESKALQELRSLGMDLRAIRLQVERKLGENKSAEEWIQVGFIIDRLLFGIYIVFISVSFITIIVIWVNSYNQ